MANFTLQRTAAREFSAEVEAIRDKINEMLTVMFR